MDIQYVVLLTTGTKSFEKDNEDPREVSREHVGNLARAARHLLITLGVVAAGTAVITGLVAIM